MQSFTKSSTGSEKNQYIFTALSEISKSDVKTNAVSLINFLQARNSDDIDLIIETLNENKNLLTMLRDEHLLIFFNKLTKKNENTFLQLIDNLREFYSHKDSPDVAFILSNVDFDFQNPIIDLIRTQNVHQIITIKEYYVKTGKLSQPTFVFLLQNTLKDHPLFIAAGLNDVNKMNELIKAGVDVNKESGQITVLYLALACAQKEAVEFLLKNKACFKYSGYDAMPLDFIEMYSGKKFLEIDEGIRLALEHTIKFFIKKVDTCVEFREVLLKSIELFNKNQNKQGQERYTEGLELLVKYNLIYEIFSDLKKTNVFNKIIDLTEQKIQEKEFPQPNNEPLRTQALLEIKKLSNPKKNSFNFFSSRDSDNNSNDPVLLTICSNINVNDGFRLRKTADELGNLLYNRQHISEFNIKP